MLLLDPQIYRDARQRILQDDHHLRPVREALLRRARTFAAETGPAVTDKAFTRHSPSRDPHDYVSIRTYWWPNPDSPDGLPYIRRDGHVSSESPQYDRLRWDAAADGIVTLSRAAFLLDDTIFAATAAQRVRRWFLDPTTCMNPHLEHAQFLPGVDAGSGLGIIEFALYLPTMLDHLDLLTEAGDAWSTRDREGMRAWCGEFLRWLLDSRLGQDECKAGNNHGTWYDLLVAFLALYLDQPQIARETLERTRVRVDRQIEPDGTMPHELKRTCSFSYTLMNTRGFVDLAWLGRSVGIDLWPHTGHDGRGIRVAVDALYRFAASDEAWPWEQIEPIDWRMLRPILAQANRLGGSYDLGAVAHRLPQGETAATIVVLEPVHPFGESRAPGAPTDANCTGSRNS